MACRKRSVRGFTLVELLLVVFVLVLIVFILGPRWSSSPNQEQARRAAMCSANLNAMGKAFYLYFSENSDRYPLLASGSPVAPADQLTATLLTSDARPFSEGWTGQEYGTSVQANLFLLQYNRTIGSEKVLCCPSTTDAPTDRTAPGAGRYGFANGTNVSYGMQLWAEPGDRPRNAAWLRSKMDGEVAIVADEGDPANLDAASPNHNGEGGSVLYHGGYVIFQTDARTAGWGKNNIYRRDLGADGRVQAAPGGWEFTEHVNDSVIVHTNDPD